MRNPSGPNVTHPPRFWWLKRLALGALGLAAVLAGIRVLWGNIAQRRLASELAPLVARGEAVNGPGMNIAHVPDEENGALLYIKAVQSNKGTSPAQSTNGSFPDAPPYPPAWHKLSENAVTANRPVYALARQARGYRRFDWNVKVGTPAFAAMLPHLASQRNLANLVGDAALYAHVHGDNESAVELVRDVRHMALASDAPPTFLVSHLVAIGIDALALERLEVIAPALEIAPEGAAPNSAAPPLLPALAPLKRPATRAQLRALLAELLDETGRPVLERSGIEQALAGERAGQLDTARWFGRGARLLRPMFDLDTVRTVRATNAMIDASAAPDWPAAGSALRANAAIPAQQPPGALSAAMFGGPASRQRRRPVDYTRLISMEVGLLPTSRGIEQDMRARTERRMAAVSVAVQLYRADHAGQWPPTLNALVPQYLPAVPLDPLAGGGQPLQYIVAKGVLPGGGDRPVVYSVGENGADDTRGNPKKLPFAPSYGWIGRGLDQWRDLSRWQPPPPATAPSGP